MLKSLMTQRENLTELQIELHQLLQVRGISVSDLGLGSPVRDSQVLDSQVRVILVQGSPVLDNLVQGSLVLDRLGHRQLECHLMLEMQPMIQRESLTVTQLEPLAVALVPGMVLAG